LDIFISVSPYTDPVDVKKLEFIFSAISNYANSRQKKLNTLHILDVACGRGGITLPLASLQCQVKAFDINEKDVEILRAQANRTGLVNLDVVVDNAFTFEDGKAYDIVIASEVFEHVLDPSKLAANIVKRMMEDSLLIVTTPNGYGPWEIKNRFDIRTYLRKSNYLRRLLNKPLYTNGSGVDHCQFYTKVRLERLFSKFSLSLIRFASSDSFLTIFPSLRRNAFLGNIDIRLADVLPHWLASGWYFVFELKSIDNHRAS
jgi:SAM-dependent methyltransferase